MLNKIIENFLFLEIIILNKRKLLLMEPLQHIKCAKLPWNDYKEQT